MKTSVIIKLVVCIVLFIILLNIGLAMISTPNTVENIIGFFIIVSLLVITIKTKCLTTIELKSKRDEK